MKIQTIAVSKINPAVYNPRKDLKPDDIEYKQLLRSIDEFGYVQPLVWNKQTGNLVGGHQRLKILLAMVGSKAPNTGGTAPRMKVPSGRLIVTVRTCITILPRRRWNWPSERFGTPPRSAISSLTRFWVAGLRLLHRHD